MLKPCNKVNIRKLVEALESGRYLQTKGCLRKKEGKQFCYCCLGVATDLRILDEGDDDWSRTGTSIYYYDSDNPVSFLSSKTRDWLGIKENDPWLLASDGLTKITASAMNDDGHSFETIAAAFRRTYLEE